MYVCTYICVGYYISLDVTCTYVHEQHMSWDVILYAYNIMHLYHVFLHVRTYVTVSIEYISHIIKHPLHCHASRTHYPQYTVHCD